MTRNPWALKEWASVVKRLEDGRAIVLLRKGGIAEAQGEFTVEHREFFLYPTFEHQRREELVPEAHADLEAVLRHPPSPGMITFTSYATVALCQWVEVLETLKRLAPFQALTPQAIERRVRYGHRPGLHAIALRVWGVVPPLELPVDPAYDGCKSWVKLRQELPVELAHPACPDQAFLEQLQAIQALLT